MIVKYDSKGRAIRIRHQTNHGYPKFHSNPHDHKVSWEKPDGSPNFNHSQINYFDGNVPEFKHYNIDKRTDTNMSDMNFHTIYGFKNSLENGTEIIFEYKNKEYAAFNLCNGNFVLCRSKTGNEDEMFSSVDELLNAEFDGKKLRSLITELNIIHRKI